ncbi:mannose-1-phosphate guanylyltransferase/mannose-6-phosphate isomerase [Curvibacter sp. HBC61]|uniref:mannose-1-phosphate guanylyltransferase n=1 Tax=Curvibacter cyanobacteriorum TaxID=3026422 RepID=A0ABT5MY17_9BURK|nr:mannose-1-phosphate guanylyltransferase/mannose-6-phosphate isomerase [Curvibacter sp. HBC61]MDD0838239.1 mannose-1-phosphate guanylyltransferase/mannose-6-phosphate isomerase [Curvibacter sp. HBC61]
MTVLVQPVILCGGSGSRLWPLSREHYPKQLLKLVGQHTLLQDTALRLTGSMRGTAATFMAPVLVGNDEYRFLLAEQLRAVGVKPAALVLEPMGRNTAPALTLGALAASVDGADPVMVVMPADHVIQDEDAFQAAVAEAVPLANEGKLVTFGIQATAPETGYGYIRRGAAIVGSTGFGVAEFVEKPSSEIAQAYLDSGEFFWNGGIFVIKASVWLEKMRQLQPAVHSASLAAFEARKVDADFVRPDKTAFATSPSDSIDYAIMERLASTANNTGEVVVIPLAANWSDVGAWNAVWDISPKNSDGNALVGDALAIDTSNSLVMAHSRLVACVGLTDVVVVETPDAVLVASRAHIQKVKEVVNQLKAGGRTEASSSRKVHRPWGWYDSVDMGERFQVKRIVVKPGASLSLQMHHHRAEHWIVVQGTARVTRGNEVYLVAENQSTYIPLGEKHRLDNPGKLPLEMIEVQSGTYLGEDDIVRYEDVYGR